MYITCNKMIKLYNYIVNIFTCFILQNILFAFNEGHVNSTKSTIYYPSAHPSYSHYYLLSPSTLFFFFVHLIVFCTSYCFALFFISLHILLLFLLFLPYVCPCVMLLYIICILIILHCPLSGPDSITFHF